MQTIEEILESKFVKDLLQNPKPTFLPYFKAEGPTITADNKAVIVEALMLDYLRKKTEILQHFKDYENKKSDLEVLFHFQSEVESKVGSQISVMHFYMYDPSKDLKEQIEQTMLEENFVSWAIN